MKVKNAYTPSKLYPTNTHMFKLYKAILSEYPKNKENKCW